MKQGEGQQDTGTADAPVVIIDSQDVLPSSSQASQSPQPQACSAVETSKPSGSTSSASPAAAGAVVLDSSQSQVTDGSPPDVAGDARSSVSDAPVSKKKRKRRSRQRRKHGGKEQESQEEGEHGKGKKRKKSASGAPPHGDRIAEGGTVWQRLGVCKCDKCGFTSNEESIFQVHICSSKKSTPSTSPRACGSPALKTPSSVTSSGAMHDSEPVVQTTHIPLVSVHPAREDAMSVQQPPQSQKKTGQQPPLLANQSGVSSSTVPTGSSKDHQTSQPVAASSSVSEAGFTHPHSGPSQAAPSSARQGEITYEPSKDEYICKQCGFAKNGIDFIEHLMFQMIANPYHCQYCPKSFAERLSFHRHCASEHPKEKKKCKLRQVSLVTGLMNRAKEEAKVGKPVVFSFHSGFRGCVRKQALQKKTAASTAPSCNRTTAVAPAAGSCSDNSSTDQVAISASSTAVTTVSETCSSRSTTGSLHFQSEASATASRKSAALQVSDTSAVSTQNDPSPALSSVDGPSSAHLEMVQRPVTCVSEEVPSVIMSATQSTSSNNAMHLENGNISSTSESVVDRNSSSEVTEAVEQSAAEEADCQIPVIIACQGNYSDHEGQTANVTQSAGTSSSSALQLPGQAVTVDSGDISSPAARPGAAASSLLPVVPGPVRTPTVIPVSSSPIIHSQNSSVAAFSLLHTSSGSGRSTVSTAPALPISQRPPVITPHVLRPLDGAQPGQTRCWRFHQPSSTDSPPGFRNTRPTLPMAGNAQRMGQKRNPSSSPRQASPPVSRPPVHPQPRSSNGASTVHGPVVQNHFIPIVSMVPGPGQSAFMQRLPQQHAVNVSVHQRPTLLPTLVAHPIFGQAVRVGLPGNVRFVQGATAQNFVPVTALGPLQQLRILPSETTPQNQTAPMTQTAPQNQTATQNCHPAVAAESTALTNCSPISPAVASPGPIFTPISPASPTSNPVPTPFTQISPAYLSRGLSSVYTTISPASSPRGPAPVYTPISPAPTGHYSPISPPSQSVHPPFTATDSSLSQPLDLSVTVSSQQPCNVMSSSVRDLARRINFDSECTAPTSFTTATASTTSVGGVSCTVTSTSINSGPAPVQIQVEPATTVGKIKQEKKDNKSQGSSPSSAVPHSSSTPPVHLAPPTTTVASQQSVSVEKYFIKYKGSYACLRCSKRFHDSDEFYQHVWNHQHADGKRCSNCSEEAASGQNRCTETTRVVERVSGVLMDVGLLSHLRADCREKFSRRLLQSDAGDARAASVDEAADVVQQSTCSVPTSAGDAARDAPEGSVEVTLPTPAGSVSVNEQNEPEKAPHKATDTGLSTEGSGGREGLGVAQGGISDVLSSDTALPPGSTSNRNTSRDQDQNSGVEVNNRQETDTASNATESENCAGFSAGSVAHLPTTEQCLTEIGDGEDHVSEKGEGNNLPKEKEGAVACAETGQRNRQEGSDPESRLAGCVQASAQEGENGANGEEAEKGSDTGAGLLADKDLHSCDRSEQSNASNVMGEDSQEFALSSDNTPDMSEAPPPPRREPPVYNRSEVFFICALCDFSCCLATDFTMHLNSEHHENATFPCYHCNYQGQYTTDLTNHITAHTTGDSKIYTCPCASTLKCPFRTDSLKSLSNHVQCHPGHAFWCNKCASEFEDDTGLLLHLTFNSMTLYSCSKCPSRFLEKAAIQRHWQAQHNGGLVFRVVKMLLCKERKENNYRPPPCSLPPRRLSAEEEASTSHQGSPTRRASAPDQVSGHVACDAVSQALPACRLSAVNSDCPERHGCIQDLGQASSGVHDTEVAQSEMICTSQTALEGTAPCRRSEEEKASDLETNLHVSSVSAPAASEESSSSSAKPSAGSTLSADTSGAQIHATVESPDSPAVPVSSSQNNTGKKTNPFSISRDKIGQIRQLFSQIKFPAKIDITGSGEDKQQNDPACNRQSENTMFKSDSKASLLAEMTSSSLRSGTAMSAAPESVAMLNQNARLSMKNKNEDEKRMGKSKDSSPQGKCHDETTVMFDETPALPAGRSEGLVQRTAEGESVSVSRDQVTASTGFRTQPEDMVPLKELLGADELHNLLLNTLCHERRDESGRYFVCSVCEKELRKRIRIHEHVFNHFSVPFIMCALCSFGCASKTEFVNHFGTAHPGERKVCKYLMVPRSNPLRQLTNEGPLTVEKFGEFCRSFRCEENENSENATSQSMYQGASTSHSHARDPHIGAREQHENVQDHQSTAEAQNAKSTVVAADNEKRDSAEEAKLASLQHATGFESLKMATDDIGNTIVTKDSAKCGVKSSTSSMITHRRNSGQGCSRDFNHNDSSPTPEKESGMSGTHLKPMLKSKKQAVQGSPARPKPGTYTKVKVGAMIKLKCIACGSMTLSPANMCRHLDTCARYINSQRDSEHTNRAESLAKSMRTGSENYQRSFSEDCAPSTSSEGADAISASRAETDENSQARMPKRRTSQHRHRPGPLSSKLASLKLYKLGDRDKEASSPEPLEMLPQLSRVKRRMNREKDGSTREAMMHESVTQPTDNRGSGEDHLESGADVRKASKEDTGNEHSETLCKQSNMHESHTVTDLQSTRNLQEEEVVMKCKKSSRVIYSSSSDEDADNSKVSTPLNDLPDATALAESREKSEQIFTCKYCDFQVPECQRLDLQTHLQKKHPSLLQLAKCGHCGYIYNSSKAGYLKNHTRMFHSGMEECKENLPLDYFYKAKLKENCSPKSDQEERYTAAGKEPTVKRKNTAKRTGPKVGTVEAGLAAACKKVAEVIQKVTTSATLEMGAPKKDSTGLGPDDSELHVHHNSAATSDAGETPGPSSAAFKPATQKSLLRSQDTERSIWSAVGAPASILAARERENKTSKSTCLSEDSAPKLSSVSAFKETPLKTVDRKSVAQPQNALKPTESETESAYASSASAGPALQKFAADLSDTAGPDGKSTAKPPVNLQKPSAVAEAAGTISLPEPGSKKSVLKPQNTTGVTHQAGSEASKLGDRETLLKSVNTPSPAGAIPGTTNKASVSKNSAKKRLLKEREGVVESVSEPVVKKCRVSATSSEDEFESTFQSQNSTPRKRKRDHRADTAKRGAAKTAKLTMQAQLGEGESDPSNSSDEDFDLKKHTQRLEPNKGKRYAFLDTEDFKSNKKPARKAKMGVLSASSNSKAKPDSSCRDGSPMHMADKRSAKSSSSMPSTSQASSGSTGSQQSGQRQAEGRTNHLGVGGAGGKSMGYMCVKCNQRHMDVKKMKAHLIRHIDYRTIPCCCCSMEFMEVTEAKQHHSTKHPNKEYNMMVSRDPEVELKLKRLLEECRQKALREGGAATSEENTADTDHTVEKGQTVIWKQSIKCRQCQALHDSISEFKKHWEDKHKGKMEWVDMKTQAVHNLKGWLLQEGPGSHSLLHKYMCAFCSLRAVNRDLLTAHKQEAHPDIVWQWTLTLHTTVPAKPPPRLPHPKAAKPVPTASPSSSSPSPAPAPAPNPAAERREQRGEENPNNPSGSKADNIQELGLEGSSSDGKTSRLKLPHTLHKDPKLKRACVAVKDFLNGHNQEEVSHICRSYGITSIQFDGRSRSSKHKKLLEPERT